MSAKEKKKLAEEAVKEGISYATIPGINFMISLYDYIRKKPSTFDQIHEMYKSGLRLVNSANEEIITFATLKHEDKYEIKGRFDEYYLSLYHKMVTTSQKKPLKIFRYLNQTDEEKYSEAIVLRNISNKSTCNIYHTETPIEMVLTDKANALVGFPDTSGKLAFGLSIKNKEQSFHLAEWTKSLTLRPGSHTHSKKCLSHIEHWLSNETYKSNIQNCFDSLSFLYDYLYNKDVYGLWLENLARKTKDHFRRVTNRKIIDLGCGTALQMQKLTALDFSYVGVDISKKMIDIAKERNMDGKASFHQEEITKYLLERYDEKSTQYDVFLFLGNTFDYFLSEFHKNLILSLVNALITPGGIVIFSGAKFNNKENPVTRDLYGWKKNKRIEYRDEWIGRYCRRTIYNIKEGIDPEKISSIVMDATEENFLLASMEKMNFKKLEGWEVAGSIGIDYEIIAFEKQEMKL